MADNLIVDEGTGSKSARTDEVATDVHVPFVKIMDGTTDGTNAAIVDSSGNLQVETTNPSITGTAGAPNSALLGVQGPTAPDAAIAAYPLTVGGRGSTATPTAASADGDVVNGWFDLNGRLHVVHDSALPTGTNSIGKLTDDQKIDINKIAGASVAVSNGTAATSLRVTLASDSTGQVALAAGTNGIGKLTANSGVDIGDVDVLSLPALTVAKCIQWSNYTNIYTSAQTSQDLVAASGAQVFYIGRITVTANYNTSQAGRTTVQIYFGTGAVSDTSKHVFRGTFITVPAASTESYPGHTIGNGSAPFIISAASDALKITTTTSGTHCGVFVSVDYIRV